MIHSLPFLLASVLRQFDADLDVKDKLGHLLDFFEALSIFVATLMLSELTIDSNAREQEFTPKVTMSKKVPFVLQINPRMALFYKSPY